MATRKNAVDREFAKIASMGPAQQAQLPHANDFTSGIVAMPNTAMRPKSLPELAAEYEDADGACKLYEESAESLERQAAEQRQRLEEARARRTAAWLAMQERCGAA